MLRIRRRFALVLCAFFVAIFLAVYFLINYAAPAEDKKPNFMNLDTAEALRHKMDMPKMVEMNNLENNVGEKPQPQAATYGKKARPEKIKSDNNDEVEADGPKIEENMISDNKDDTCDFDPQQVPQPNIQVNIYVMLYRNLLSEGVFAGKRYIKCLESIFYIIFTSRKHYVFSSRTISYRLSIRSLSSTGCIPLNFL